MENTSNVENITNIEKNETGFDYEFGEIIKIFVYSFIGIMIFFVPIKVNGQLKTLIYHIAYLIQSNAGKFIELSTVVFVLLGNVKRLISYKNKKLKIEKLFVYVSLLSTLIIIDIFFGKSNVFFISDNTILLMKETLLNLVTVFPLCAIFMVLLEYGLLDIVESYFQKIMKKTFKLSGKSIVVILMYLFTDCFCGFYMTNKLYKTGKLRENEACSLVLNFSVLSIPMINYITNELNIKLGGLVIEFIIVFIISNMIMCRVYPVSSKKKSYYIKTSYKETVHNNNKLKKSIKKYLSNNKKESIIKKMLLNLEESIYIIMTLCPNIVMALFLGDIIMHNIGIVDNIKYIFYPIFDLFKLPYKSDLGRYIVLSFCNTVTSIDILGGNIDYFIKQLIVLIAILKCTSFTTNIIYLNSLDFSLELKETLISYIMRVIIIILIYSIIYYFYRGYII